ncbi:MAG TPA: sulfotransferase [Allosphingosinicella sp.]|jgi:tetratricopeptide (TPR) repeat protein
MNEPIFTGAGDLAGAIANGARLLRSDPAAAAEQAREIIRVNRYEADGHWLLAAALRRMDREEDARKADIDAVGASMYDPMLFEAAMLLSENRLSSAEHMLRRALEQRPNEPAALRMLAEVAMQTGYVAEAEKLLRQTVQTAPGFRRARSDLASVLFRLNRAAEGRALLDDLLRETGGAAQGSDGDPLAAGGGYEESIRLYEHMLRRFPQEPRIWLSYGHVLKTVGRRGDAVAAYRQALALNPGVGEAWWGLADLKLERFATEDIEAMTRALESQLPEQDRIQIHFALAKALEDRGDAEAAFGHYSKGNRLRLAGMPHDADAVSDHVTRSREVFTPSFYAARTGQGVDAPDPIFVLGMPRAGSTLIEQILASHSQVEGTMELPDIPALARQLNAGKAAGLERGPYLEAVQAMTPEQVRAFGDSYMWSTRLQRKTGRPFFIDKMPNNWLHIGLILLILPNARIIDARRDPLDCCVSNFRQHFARGQTFAYSLEDLGRFYADYVRLTAHFENVFPRRIHRVVHERLVDRPEAEIRALLDHLGLPFEESCLSFHRNERAVRTASSEQVRRPINKEGIGGWKTFEPWLGPLKDALGPVIESYPEAPAAWAS